MLLAVGADIIREFWHILLDSSFYILLGILIAGFLKVFLNADVVQKHLGKGRFSSVFKAAFFGVPLPL
nr:permease [Desulfopila sp. IMCC35008]